MNFKYNCGTEVIDVNVNTIMKSETVVVKSRYVECKRTIHKDENGEFFTWNGQRVYLDSWIRTTISELQNKIDSLEVIDENDVAVAIISEGVEKIRFQCPLRSEDNNKDYIDTICKIEESANRKVKTKFRLVLTPVECNKQVQRSVDYYIKDFVNMIRKGVIRMSTT